MESIGLLYHQLDTTLRPGGLLFLVLFFMAACNGETSQNSGAQQSSCNLIGDQKCGTNSVGKAVVLECQVVDSSAESGVVKEWQIAEVCDHCCLEAMCVSASKCIEEDVIGYPTDVRGEDVVPTKPDVVKDATAAPHDVAPDHGWHEDVWCCGPPPDLTPSVDIVEEDEWCYYCYDVTEEDIWWEEDLVPDLADVSYNDVLYDPCEGVQCEDGFECVDGKCTSLDNDVVEQWYDAEIHETEPDW
jgi:hypothetical protein